MKRKWLLLTIICTLIVGCSDESKKVELPVTMNQSTEDTKESKNDSENNAIISNDSNVSTNSYNNDSSDIQIKEQSFDITLDSFGNVFFASFMPKENDDVDEDVQFKLLNESETIYTFPEVAEDNKRSGQHFENILAVAFKDCNGDEKKDVIIINEYTSKTGIGEEKRYNEVRIYLQEEDKKEFTIDSDLFKYLNENRYNDTIDSVLNGVLEYQNYKKVGYFGDYLITEYKYSGISAMSLDEINATIGNTISYQESSYAWNGNTVKASYKEESYSTEQLINDFRIEPLELLGIEEQEILEVSALTDDIFIGNHFFVINADSILVYYEGVFFEAKRIENTKN